MHAINLCVYTLWLFKNNVTEIRDRIYHICEREPRFYNITRIMASIEVQLYNSLDSLPFPLHAYISRHAVCIYLYIYTYASSMLMPTYSSYACDTWRRIVKSVRYIYLSSYRWLNTMIRPWGMGQGFVLLVRHQCWPLRPVFLIIGWSKHVHKGDGGLYLLCDVGLAFLFNRMWDCHL